MSEGYKKCPYCNKVIMGNALECKHCGASLVEGGENNNANINENISYSSGNDDFGFVEGLNGFNDDFMADGREVPDLTVENWANLH